MKRLAILVNNTDADLSTSTDIANMRKFLVSVKGGQWSENKIKYCSDYTRVKMLNLFDSVRNNNYDYVFFYFSGHGLIVNNMTTMQLKNGVEFISERDIQNLAPRQLNILDCCSKSLLGTSTTLSGYEQEEKRFSDTDKKHFRVKYLQRILASEKQRITLYACSPNQYSYDFSNGGVFTNNLLHATTHFNSKYLSAVSAIKTAAPYVMGETNSMQQPTYSQNPKVIPENRKLILAINPLAF